MDGQGGKSGEDGGSPMQSVLLATKTKASAGSAVGKIWEARLAVFLVMRDTSERRNEPFDGFRWNRSVKDAGNCRYGSGRREWWWTKRREYDVHGGGKTGDGVTFKPNDRYGMGPEAS